MSIIKYRDNESSPWQTIDVMKGRDAIHVGPSAPTDPEIDMWLDTDEPGQTVVTSVNGMSGPVTVREAGVWTQLTTTYTSNSYVSETAFNRIYAFSNGEIVVLVINLQVDSTPGATFRTIGQINLPSPLMGGIALTVAGQTGGANMLITIAYDTGVVQIYNSYGSSATGFYRTTAVMPLASAFE